GRARHQVPTKGSAATGYVIILHPRVRGRLELRSADPAAPVVISHQLLGVKEDLDDLVAGCRMLRDVAAAPPLGGHASEEVAPGPKVERDDEWDAYLRGGAARTGMHPSGTCRMGSDEQAVVDPELRVRGVSGLRVVDTSIMPELTSGNTNAPVIMVAERAADLVLGKA